MPTTHGPLALDSSETMSQTTLTIRDAAPGDASSLSALLLSHREILTIDPSGRGAERFFDSVTPAAMAEYLASLRYRFRVAEIDGELVGFLGMRDITHLFHLFIAKSQQRTGVATRLWNDALAHLAAAAIHAPITVNSNLGAIEFYRRLGFIESAPRAEMHGVSFQPMMRPA